METENFLTLKEVARILRVSVVTMNRFMREEKIPSYKVGGRRLFDKSEVIQWVRDHRSTFGAREEDK